MDRKRQFLDLIKSNIDKYEYHITRVISIIEPRYAYTIGLSELLGFELIFAGGIIFLNDDLSLIFSTIVKELGKKKATLDLKISVGTLGIFSLSSVDSSWSELMMLGVFDYYNTENINAYQIIPDSDHHTLDIPKMSNKFNVLSEPVWQWLVNKWDYAVPENSIAITNIDALKGATITEVARWEDNEWEMFAGAGPDVQKEDIRVISLGTMLGIDRTLFRVLGLAIGEGLWRDTVDSEWNNWG